MCTFDGLQLPDRLVGRLSVRLAGRGPAGAVDTPVPNVSTLALLEAVLGMCMYRVRCLMSKWTRPALGSTLLLIRVKIGSLKATLVSMFRIRLMAEPADSGSRRVPLATARRSMLLNRPV